MSKNITERGTKSAEDRVEIWELATLGFEATQLRSSALNRGAGQSVYLALRGRYGHRIQTGVQRRAVRSQYSDIGVLKYRDVGALSPSEEYEVRWY